MADSRRNTWDELAAKDGHLNTLVGLTQALQLLVVFYSPQKQDDQERLSRLSSDIETYGYLDFLSCPDVQPQLARLANVTLKGLQL